MKTFFFNLSYYTHNLIIVIQLVRIEINVKFNIIQLKINILQNNERINDTIKIIFNYIIVNFEMLNC